MGKLMDLVMAPVDPAATGAAETVRADLALLAPYCHWTDGQWEELRMTWDEVQNVPRHINELSNYLVRTYQKCSDPADEILLPRQPGPDRSGLRFCHGGESADASPAT